MSCRWCAESCPPRRKDGYCSDICKQHTERVDEAGRLRAAAQAVCRFDWSNNDDDAVAAIEHLRSTLGEMDVENEKSR